jgi:hypothetical protein
MRFQAARLREIQQHCLRKLVGMQIGRFLGLAQAVEQGLRPHAQPTRSPGKLTFEKLRSSTVPPCSSNCFRAGKGSP